MEKFCIVSMYEEGIFFDWIAASTGSVNDIIGMDVATVSAHCTTATSNTERGPLRQDLRDPQSRGALGILGWNDPMVPTQTHWAPRGVFITSVFTKWSHAFLLDFSGVFSKCHLFFPLTEKVYMYLFQYLENTEV